SSAPRSLSSLRSASFRASATSRPSRSRSSRCGCAPAPARVTRGCASLPATKKLVLIVIDGLTPSMLERAVQGGRAPALALLAEHGRYGRAVSTFPSLTPVCLSSIATGAHPDVHHIPHLVWYHRRERRFVEYGSSFAALIAAGTRRSIIDT